MISSRAGSMPPITSTTRSIVGIGDDGVGVAGEHARGELDVAVARRGCARRPGSTSRRDAGAGLDRLRLAARRAGRTRRRRCRSRARRCDTVRRRRVATARSRSVDRGGRAQRADRPDVSLGGAQRCDVVQTVDGFDDGVEAAAVEHRALAADGVRVDVEQPVELGVARPAAASPTARCRPRRVVAVAALGRERDAGRGRRRGDR